MSQVYKLDDLIYLMQRLRDPEDGCPWDIKQNLLSINASTIEEAYELVDALQQSVAKTGTADKQVQEELGDVLFQVVFYSQLAKEEQCFDLNDVIHGLTEKLIRRHPHVFPNKNLRERIGQALSEDDIKQQWETIKQQERGEKQQQGLFADIPQALPSLIRAQKIQKRTANIGFDWPDALSALTKVEEEMAELRHALQFESQHRAEEELADVLFSCVNVSRLMQCNAEQALEQANKKFQRRFSFVEAQLQTENISLDQASLMKMDELWDEAKRQGL